MRSRSTIPDAPLVGDLVSTRGERITPADMDKARLTKYAAHKAEHPLDNYADFLFTGEHQLRARTRAAMIAAGYPEHSIERYDSCCTQTFVYRHKTTGEYRLHTNTCGQRWCPRCAKAWAYRMRARILEAIPDVKHKLRFITLTLSQKKGEPLAETIRVLKASLRSMGKQDWWPTTMRAAVSVMEAVPSRSIAGAWNVHYHLAADCKYIPAKDLAHAWQAASKQRGQHVDIQLARSNGGLGVYLSGYLSKQLDERVSGDPDRLAEYLRAFRHIRRLTFHGAWYGQGIAKKIGHVAQGHVHMDAPDNWTFLGSLSTLEERAQCGDAAAQAVLRDLGLPACPWRKTSADLPRPPPGQYLLGEAA